MMKLLVALPFETLVGEWDFVFGGECGVHSGKKRGVSGSLIFSANGVGELSVDYTWCQGKILRKFGVPVSLHDGERGNSGWAPWSATFHLDQRRYEETRIYLGSPDILYLENFYYQEGVPTIAVYCYERRGSEALRCAYLKNGRDDAERLCALGRRCAAEGRWNENCEHRNDAGGVLFQYSVYGTPKRRAI